MNQRALLALLLHVAGIGLTHAGTPATPTAADPAKIWDLSALDRKPVVRQQARPTYPAALKEAGVTGTVKIELIVDPTGVVSSAKVIESSDARFDQAAVAAIERWQFEPALKAGQPVKARLVVPIVFALNRPKG
jgi:protein TonB